MRRENARHAAPPHAASIFSLCPHQQQQQEQQTSLEFSILTDVLALPPIHSKLHTTCTFLLQLPLACIFLCNDCTFLRKKEVVDDSADTGYEFARHALKTAGVTVSRGSNRRRNQRTDGPRREWESRAGGSGGGGAVAFFVHLAVRN